RPLAAPEREAHGVDGGLLVERVSGAAAKAGLRPGDVILAFGNEPVESVDELASLVDDAEGRVAVLVKRGDATIYVPVEIG
ncbi:MAG: PDZ domain-containing protein, partial [Burkholderiales bacterium]